MPKERLWADVKRAYLADEGSLRTLAKRFNVSLDTLEKRCRREGWRKAMAALGGIVAAEAAKMAAQQGQDYAKALLQVRHDLACDLAQSSSMLKGIPHENSLRGVSERNQAIAPLVQNASRVFGWEEHN